MIKEYADWSASAASVCIAQANIPLQPLNYLGFSVGTAIACTFLTDRKFS
jgi:hypothetical protein